MHMRQRTKILKRIELADAGDTAELVDAYLDLKHEMAELQIYLDSLKDIALRTVEAQGVDMILTTKGKIKLIEATQQRRYRTDMIDAFRSIDPDFDEKMSECIDFRPIKAHVRIS